MAGGLGCRELARLVDTVCGARVSDRRGCVDLLAVAWAVARRGPIGRISIAKLLGLTERRVRTAVEQLRRTGLVGVEQPAGVYALPSMPEESKLIDCRWLDDGSLLALAGPAASDLLRVIEEHVVQVRDEIVLAAEEPCVTLIGFISDEGVTAPRVPVQVLRGYADRILSAAAGTAGPTAFALLRRGCPLRCCAAFPYALYRVCTMYSSAAAASRAGNQA